MSIEVSFTISELNTAMGFGFYRLYDGGGYCCFSYKDFLPMAKKLISLGANNLSKFAYLYEVQGMYPLENNDLADLYIDGVDLEKQGFNEANISAIRHIAQQKRKEEIIN
jgi:hypothetical protein